MFETIIVFSPTVYLLAIQYLTSLKKSALFRSALEQNISVGSGDYRESPNETNIQT